MADDDGWTLKTIKALMDERNDRYTERAAAAEKAVNAALAAAEKAVSVAENNATKWRDNANEWRAAMDDKDKNFVTKETLSPALTNIERDIAELKSKQGTSAGQVAGAGMTVDRIIQIVTFLGTLGIGIKVFAN